MSLKKEKKCEQKNDEEEEEEEEEEEVEEETETEIKIRCDFEILNRIFVLDKCQLWHTCTIKKGKK